MLSQTRTVALIGTDARIVDVEVHAASGLPGFRIVGLPAKSVREAGERVRSAIESSKRKWPQMRVVANLAPGALPKEGTHFDLPLAVGVLASRGVIEGQAMEGWLIVGELALDGGVRPVRGVLPAAIACREQGLKGLVCPAANASEAAIIEEIQVVPVNTLNDCVLFLKGKWSPPPTGTIDPPPEAFAEDMREVHGHYFAKQALEIAAAGGHNVLLMGSPGAGKTMLANRLPGILPSMTSEESLEVTRIHSVAGLLSESASLITQRPFRTPHHHISVAGLVGGGIGLARPGEVSLAHRGALFLDELSLYKGQLLDNLRAPMEDGQIRLARSNGAVSYPSRFILIGAMNPCPCGYYEASERACSCSSFQLHNHRARLSGPLLDRIDMLISMHRPSKSVLLGEPSGEASETIRQRVEAARAIQSDRYGVGVTNGSAPKRMLDAPSELPRPARAALESLLDRGDVTGRGIDRIIRVARTIGDLQGKDELDAELIGGAIQYRISPEICRVVAA